MVFPTCFFILLAANVGQVRGHAGHMDDLVKVDLLMPSVTPKVESQLCHGISLNGSINIVGYEPKAKMPVAHHMLLYGCGVLGRKEDVWDCGEMQQTGKTSQYPHANVCQPDSDSSILYAWAMDAPELKLPEGVAFKVGEGSPFRYLVLQVHYKDVSQFLNNANATDNSGVTIVTSKKDHPKTAGIFLMLSDGVIPHSSTVYMDISCRYNDHPTIHPFAFRTHTHTHGKVVSGYVIKKNNTWLEIGKKDPQLPQMFYNITTPEITLEKGDIMAARCTMVNEGKKDVYIGTTSEDEMCNFYTMYWVDSPKHLIKNMYCVNPESPFKNWLSNLNAGQLETMPKDVSVIPGGTEVIRERFWDSEGGIGGDRKIKSDIGGYKVDGAKNGFVGEGKAGKKMGKNNGEKVENGGKIEKTHEMMDGGMSKIMAKKESTFLIKNKSRIGVNDIARDDYDPYDYKDLSKLLSDYEELVSNNGEGDYEEEDSDDGKYPYLESDMIRKLRNEYKYVGDGDGLMGGDGLIDGENGGSERVGISGENDPTRRHKYFYPESKIEYEDDYEDEVGDAYGRSDNVVYDDNDDDGGGVYGDVYTRKVFNKRFTPYDFLATDGMKKRSLHFIKKPRSMDVGDGRVIEEEDHMDGYIPYKRYIY